MRPTKAFRKLERPRCVWAVCVLGFLHLLREQSMPCLQIVRVAKPDKRRTLQVFGSAMGVLRISSDLEP